MEQRQGLRKFEEGSHPSTEPRRGSGRRFGRTFRRFLPIRHPRSGRIGRERSPDKMTLKWYRGCTTAAATLFAVMEAVGCIAPHDQNLFSSPVSGPFFVHVLAKVTRTPFSPLRTLPPSSCACR